MAQAKIQPFCNFANLDCIGYFNGREVFARCVKQKNECFFVYNDHFCVTFKSEVVSLKQAAEEKIILINKLWIMIAWKRKGIFILS